MAVTSANQFVGAVNSQGECLQTITPMLKWSLADLLRPQTATSQLPPLPDIDQQCANNHGEFETFGGTGDNTAETGQQLSLVP